MNEAMIGALGFLAGVASATIFLTQAMHEAANRYRDQIAGLQTNLEKAEKFNNSLKDNLKKEMERIAELLAMIPPGTLK